MVMLLEAKNKIEAILSHLEANLGRRLPFKGLLMRKLAEHLGANIQVIADAIDKAQADGSATKAIDLLVDYLRDSMPLPALLRPLAAPFARMFLERIRSELHANQDLILDSVGAVVAPKPCVQHETAGDLACEARELREKA